MIDTKIDGFRLRFASEEDVPLILGFIRALAQYEHLENEVEATEELLRDSIFRQGHAQVLIGESEGAPACFALFFYNLSTFTGRPGIYLEDLFVKPEYRGRGYGKALLTFLADYAKKNGCARVEWSCLDWNKPSIGFYESIGAFARREWISFRLHREALGTLAEEF